MSTRFLASLGVLSAVITAVSLASVPAAGHAQLAATKTAAAEKAAPNSPIQASSRSPKVSAKAKPWIPTRTPWGDPDLEGLWPSIDMQGTPYERPPEFAGRSVLTDEAFAEREAQARRQAQADSEEFVSPPPGGGDGTGPPSHWGERGKPSRQTALVVDPPDGTIPPMTPQGQKRTAALRSTYVLDHPFETFEDLGPYDRCITRGVLASTLPTGYNMGNEILQTPGYVVIRHEMIHETRIIPLDGRPHVGRNIRTYMGDPRGHWEGMTLVVETTNFNGKVGIRRNGNIDLTSEALRLIERFTRVDADTIQYEATIDDPKTWTRSWKVALPLKQHPEYRMFEYACHEGNYGMRNILAGARAEDKAAEEAALRNSR